MLWRESLVTFKVLLTSGKDWSDEAVCFLVQELLSLVSLSFFLREVIHSILQVFVNKLINVCSHISHEARDGV